jgi:Kef-type K+ transport system membrane component KefB
MRNYKNILFYCLVTGSFLVLMYWILQSGKTLEVNKTFLIQRTADADFLTNIKDKLSQNVGTPLAILLLQIITILLTARIFGYLFHKAGQPFVVGEIVAGIFLGPSLLGRWFPGYTSFFFPKASMQNLQFFSQVGLMLFLFVIGMELDLSVLRTKARQAIIISHASIIIPYALGMGLSFFLYETYAPPNINFLSFSLFIGIAMSITAFPVLARILQERGMSRSRLGGIAIACAAADDITAWCILAAVISIVKGNSAFHSLVTIGMVIVYILVMMLAVKPFLEKISKKYAGKDVLSLNIVVLMFGVLILSSYTTEVIGIHALFGAFLAGVVMPSTFNFRKILIEKIDYVSVGLLLPLFFAFSGLRTQFGLLNSTHEWVVCGAILSVAILGKFGGSMLAAKFVGESWKDSIVLGALINTRGLMELVVLNIGYDLGILTPEVFAMMIGMALVTTMMTGPMLNLMKFS